MLSVGLEPEAAVLRGRGVDLGLIGRGAFSVLVVVALLTAAAAVSGLWLLRHVKAEAASARARLRPRAAFAPRYGSKAAAAPSARSPRIVPRYSCTSTEASSRRESSSRPP
jgi:hypothetical protein